MPRIGWGPTVADLHRGLIRHPDRCSMAASQQGVFAMATEEAAAQPQHSALVASDRVEGTAVYGPGNRRIGRIERLMIDKASGQVAYAVLTFGGFLGIGEDHYPLPWAKLNYETALDGYKIDVTEHELRDAPRFGKDDYWDWSGRHEQVHKHYGVDPIWY
jgi:hypothetical protein